MVAVSVLRMDMAPAVVLERVCCGCLAELDLVVSAGERVGVIGPNGAGKTTLLRLCAGLLLPARGQVRLRAPAGYVPQAYAASLLPWRTARQNVALAARHLAPSALEAALEDVGLGATECARAPGRLSGGEQQRVALARALVASPPLLLHDEPLSAVDLPGRSALRARLAERCRATGAALVLASHDVEDLVTLVDRVVILGGRPARVVRTLHLAGVPRIRARARLEQACAGAA